MKTVPAILALPQSAPEGRSLLRTLLDGVPSDPASIVTLLLGVGAVGLVIWFGRPKGDSATRPE